MVLRKAISFIHQGIFWYKLKGFINRKIPFYKIENNSEINLHQQYQFQKWLKKKYGHLLDTPVDFSIRDVENINLKRIWICWFQGEKNMPPLVKACTNSIRKGFPDYDIVIISDSNISEYVQFPEYIKEKRKRGIIGAAHYSDLLRTELLCRYGGIWCDATLLYTGSTDNRPSYLECYPLFVFKSLDLSKMTPPPIQMSNWFIVSNSQSKILLKTRELLYEYWKNENYVRDYFLYHLFFMLAARKFVQEWESIPVFNNQSPHVLQFEFENHFCQKRWDEIKKMSDFHKLNHHIDYKNDQLSFYDHVLQLFLKGHRYV